MKDQCGEKELQAAIDYWLETAEQDVQIAQYLFEGEKYAWSLFLVHLVMEKMLKALWVFSNKKGSAPRIHNLLKLAEECGIKLNDAEKDELQSVTNFNIESRYPEERKSFYQICTKRFASKYFQVMEKWRKRVRKILKKS